MELRASDSTAGVLVTRPLRVGQVRRLLHLAMGQVTALLDLPLAIILITRNSPSFAPHKCRLTSAPARNHIH
jgi:hypothetical protein